MSSNPFENLFYMIKSLSNTETIRAIAKGLGIAFNGKSSVGTELLDTITGNYNYLNGINYDIESQTLTIDNSSVDKLREEIKKYYYNSIGLKEKNQMVLSPVLLIALIFVLALNMKKIISMLLVTKIINTV